MKSAIRELLVMAALTIAASAHAQSAAEYQAAIRAATEAYRGDCVELSDIVVYAEYYDPEHDIHIPYYSRYMQQPLALRLEAMSLDFDASTLRIRGAPRQDVHMLLFDVPR